MDIKGSGAIVTGAASGMGRATAARLVSDGAKVAMLDVNVEGLEVAAAEIGGTAVPCDMGDRAATAAAVQHAIEAVGAPRIVVSCAGIGRLEPVIGPMAVPFEQLEETISVNLIGTLQVVTLAATHLATQPALEDGERGVVIMVASGAAFDGPEASAAYTASKGGIASMTLALAREYGNLGIRVLCISPGAFDTAMIRSATPQMLEMIPKTTPFPKRMGAPKEFAALAAHICENRFLNGSVLRLDGAQRMPYFSDV